MSLLRLYQNIHLFCATYGYDNNVLGADDTDDESNRLYSNGVGPIIQADCTAAVIPKNAAKKFIK